MLPAAAEWPSKLRMRTGLVVRSATKVTRALLERRGEIARGGARGRGRGQRGYGRGDASRRAGDEHAGRKCGERGGTHFCADAGAARGRCRRRMPSIHAGKWEKSAFSGMELRGKTLGLVGLGRIGSEVARRARALEMKVLAHDPYVTPAAAREVDVELFRSRICCGSRDVLSLHTALSPATEKIINAAALAQMKKGARLINCARGELIDEGGAGGSVAVGASGGRGAGYVCAGAAEEFSAHRTAECDCDAAYCGLDGGSAGRSGHGRSRSRCAIIWRTD